jgi:putative FmdB family regulatory protein
MPTYEYECKKCGHGFSLIMAMGEHGKKKSRCPKCKSEQVKQVITSVFVTTSKKS